MPTITTTERLQLLDEGHRVLWLMLEDYQTGRQNVGPDTPLGLVDLESTAASLAAIALTFGLELRCQYMREVEAQPAESRAQGMVLAGNLLGVVARVASTAAGTMGGLGEVRRPPRDLLDAWDDLYHALAMLYRCWPELRSAFQGRG